MILTMIDAEHRMKLYKYNGNGLEELAMLKVATDDPTELAQIAATIALMTGETNGSTPPAKSVASTSYTPGESAGARKRRLDRERHARKREEQRALTPASTPQVKKPKAQKNIRITEDYAPVPGTAISRILEEIEAHGPITAADVATSLGMVAGSVSASLSSDLTKRGVVSAEKRDNGTGRMVGWYSITEHGRAAIDRSRGHLPMQ